MKAKRIHTIDLLRGFAVLLMVIYHFVYDVSYFGYWEVDLNVELEWKVFRYIIISLFLFAVGISLNLRHSEKIHIRSVFKRVVVLGVASAIISVVSFFQFPISWIYFGIIHFILVATLAGLFLRRLPNVCLVLAVLIVLGYAQGYLATSWLYETLQPIFNLPKYTEDLIRFFPWFGVVLLGMYFSYYRFYDLSPVDYDGKLQETTHIATKGLLLMGRHALLVYLIHQPILFAGFLLVEQVF